MDNLENYMGKTGKIIIVFGIPLLIIFLLIFGGNSDQWWEDRAEPAQEQLETVDDIDEIICENGEVIPRVCELFCDDQRFLEMCIEDVKKALELP